MNLLELISDKDFAGFSQNYPIQRSFMGDALFPGPEDRTPGGRIYAAGGRTKFTLCGGGPRF